METKMIHLKTKIIRHLLKLKKEADAGKNLSPTFTDPKAALAWLHAEKTNKISRSFH